MASNLMAKSKKIDPYLTFSVMNHQSASSRLVDTQKEEKLVENTIGKHKFSDFCLGTTLEETMQLPATIDSVRAMIAASDTLPIDLRAIRMLELIKRLEFVQAKSEAHHKRNLSEEIKVENCRLEVVGRSRIAERRLRVALLEQWFHRWANKFEKQDTSYQSLAEMGDVLTYCSLEFKKSLDKQCQVHGRLFSGLFNQVNSVYTRAFLEIEKFFTRLSDFKQEVIKKADERVKMHEIRVNDEISSLNEKIVKKEETIHKLTFAVRELNAKLSKFMHVNKNMSIELRQMENNNDVLVRENQLISETIKNVLKDLRGTLTLE